MRAPTPFARANFWRVNTFYIHHPSSLNESITRGRPMVMRTGYDYGSLNINTDQRKTTVPGLRMDRAHGINSLTNRFSANPTIAIEPAANILVSVGPGYTDDQDELAQAPEFSSLRMRRGRPTISTLLSAAEGMARAAAPYSSVFTGNGLPADFIAQLNSSAESLRASDTAHKNMQGRRRTATHGIQARLSEARRIVHVLDSFVRIALNGDPTLLANWNSVKRVPKTRTAPPRVAAA